MTPPPQRMIRGVIVDLDGTLADTPAQLLKLLWDGCGSEPIADR